MLPPPLWGGKAPATAGSSGCVPIVPRKGAIGTRTPGITSTERPSRRSKVPAHGSGKSSGRRPLPGRIAIQPQSPGVSDSTSTLNVVPGRAPSTQTGPDRW